MSQDLKADLQHQVADGHALVVVGSGVSMGATRGAEVAGWGGLLLNGVDRCSEVATDLLEGWEDWTRRQIRSGKTEEMIRAAAEIERHLKLKGTGEYRRWLKDTVGSLHADDRLVDRSVLEAIQNLGVPIATTNYDGLLEEVTGWNAVTWQEPEKAQEVIRGDREGILHLHGYWDEPESVVLGLRSYEAVLGDVPAQAFQQAIGQLYSLVFVGCGVGLRDPNFGALLAWLKQHFSGSAYRHFRLALEGEMEALKEEHEGERIFPLPYGKKHAALAPFLCDLAADRKKAPLPRPAPTRGPVRGPVIPPRRRRFGREDLLEELVGSLVAEPPLPAPVLGGPGVGKSHLTIAALHDSRVEERFGPRRYFVRCEGAATAEALLGEVAQVLGRSGSNLLPAVETFLAEAPAALVLDNAETPWETPEGREETEELLARLAGLPGVALVASLRGGQRPLGVPWREAIPVEPLDTDPARALFLSIAGEAYRDDPHLERLLGAVEGVPLAVELLAAAAEGGGPALEGLWQRWREEHTALLRRGAADSRTTNMEASFELSIKGPRMGEEATRLLTLLGLLPDGAAAGDLEALLPSAGRRVAAQLVRVGLAYWERDRVRTLAPLREYVHREYPPAEEDEERALVHYFRLAEKLGPSVGAEGGGRVSERLTAEVANLEVLLNMGLDQGSDLAIHAALALTDFHRFAGLGSARTLIRAAEAAGQAGRLLLQAHCVGGLGDIALQRSDHTTARERYQQALHLFNRVDSVLGQARCIFSLGEIALRRSDDITARQCFEKARRLHERAGDVLGQANCTRSLGDVALWRSDYVAARERYEKALPLFQGVGDILGRANCIQSLGDIALWRSDLAMARERYGEALPLFERVGDLVGRANCIKGLGDVFLERSELSMARQQYTEALPLYERVGDILGQANCIKGLGHVALAGLELAMARQQYSEALPLYERVSDILGQANCIQSLGDLALKLDRRAEAAQRFHMALDLFRSIGEPLSMGETHCRLARLAEDEAARREHVEAARELWTQIDRPDLVGKLQEEFAE